MQRTILLRAAAVLAVAALAACDAPTNAAPEKQPDDLARQVEALGFRGDMVQDFGDYVVVEGDIRLTRAQLEGATPPRSDGALGPRFQYRTNVVVGSPKVQDIRVDLSGLAAEPGWENAARTAIGLWSQVPNAYVRIVEGAPADITFSLGCLPGNTAAVASWPSGGNPGTTITANQAGCIGFGQNDQQRLHNMVHEIGHTLGFRHTNWNSADCVNSWGQPVSCNWNAGTVGAVQISGTPSSGGDPGSVMNGGTATNQWAGFSTNDLWATRVLYPLPAAPTSVSDAGGTPLVSWSAPVGAQSYTVSMVRTIRSSDRADGIQTDDFPVGTTTGTSILDPDQYYTGESSNTFFDGEKNWYITCRYRVVATFATGTSTATVPAPVC